jgi:hypothetical protein
MSEKTSTEPDQHRVAHDAREEEGERGDARWGYEDSVDWPEPSEQPDVFLDVPLVKVDEIGLEVEDLRARVSLQAEVLDLLRLNVGADVALGRVSLDIKGVEAQAQLRVRLDNVAAILNRVLTTIDRNPQILEHVTRGLEAATREVGGGVGKAVEEVGGGAGKAVEEVGGGAGKAAEEVGGGAGKAAEETGRTVRDIPQQSRGTEGRDRKPSPQRTTQDRDRASKGAEREPRGKYPPERSARSRPDQRKGMRR